MNRKKDALQGFLYVLPSLILITIFSIIPIFMNGYFSFTKYNILQPAEWVGLANYERLVSDQFVIASLKNTIIFTVVSVPLQTIISLLLGVLLANKFRNKFGGFVKSAMFIPVIASTVLVGTLWSMFLSSNGPVNAFITMLGGSSVNWLGSPNTALLCVCAATIWKNVGYFLVIYYAGLMDIPPSLYEAADVDGATGVQKFFHITLPSLKNVTFLVVTLGTIWSFQVFDLVYTMTGGGPGLSTVTLVLTIYNAAFKEYNMGYASAIAMVMFVFVLIVSGLQKLLLNRKEK